MQSSPTYSHNLHENILKPDREPTACLKETAGYSNTTETSDVSHSKPCPAPYCRVLPLPVYYEGFITMAVTALP